MKKSKTNKKLASAAAMLLLSAAMLGTSTYAWFTMNKEVQVTGMQMKAHAEEGLLINEVKAADSGTWDEAAIGAVTPTVFELRPASTSNLSDWWHANSKKFADEAGIDALTDTVDVDNAGNKYTNISAATDQTIIGTETAATGEKATGNSQAETHVFYSDASFGTASQYDNGEGFYVNYKYYLKSSSSTALQVTDLQVEVTAEKKNTETAAQGASLELDKALRVGVKIDSNFLIFAPVTGADASYKVTKNVKGDDNTTVAPVTAATNINADPTNSKIEIPAVTGEGKLVDVYVWFEGEDTNCMSKNLTAVLDHYDITIKFTDADIQ